MGRIQAELSEFARNRSTWVSALCGGLLGMLISFMVAAVLLEIANNAFFAIYFGLLFLVIGLAIFKRVTISNVYLEGGKVTRALLATFSVIVLVASVSCFLVNHNTLKLSKIQRIPFFAVLGIAVSFAVTFAVVDVFNSFLKSIQTPKQVFVVLGSSVATGFLFGLIFGMLGAEDDSSPRHALFKDERYSAPLGFLVGVLGGLVHAFDQHQHSPSSSSSFSMDKWGEFGSPPAASFHDDGL